MIDTRIEGDPAALRAVADYLGGALGVGTSEFAHEIIRRRKNLRDVWEGEAGEAGAERLTILVRAGDRVAQSLREVRREVDALADTLHSVQDALAEVRTSAVAAGLAVTDDRISMPPDDAGLGVLSMHALYGPAMNEARDRTAEIGESWNRALATCLAAAERHQATLTSIALPLMATALRPHLLRQVSRIAAAQAAHLRDDAQRNAAHARALTEELRSGRVRPYPDFYSRLDDLLARERAAHAGARAADHLARNPRLPPALDRGLKALGPIGAGVGVVSDLAAGESPQQAVVSQSGGLAGSLLVGGLVGAGSKALAGAALGSAIPGAGTIVGAVAGGIAGVAAGIGADRAVDRFYERPARERAASERAEAERDARQREARAARLLNGPTTGAPAAPRLGGGGPR